MMLCCDPFGCLGCSKIEETRLGDVCEILDGPWVRLTNRIYHILRKVLKIKVLVDTTLGNLTEVR